MKYISEKLAGLKELGEAEIAEGLPPWPPFPGGGPHPRVALEEGSQVSVRPRHTSCPARASGDSGQSLRPALTLSRSPAPEGVLGGSGPPSCCAWTIGQSLTLAGCGQGGPPFAPRPERGCCRGSSTCGVGLGRVGSWVGVGWEKGAPGEAPGRQRICRAVASTPR